MGQTHIQTRVPDEFAERIDEYQENGDYMNRAEAIRSLLRDGLEGPDHDGSDEIEDETRPHRAGMLPPVLSLLLLDLIGTAYLVFTLAI